MGSWLVFGATLLGATCFVYDGAPDFPGPDRLWTLVERQNISVLGVSPTLIRSLITHGEEPVRKHDLSSLRAFALWLFDVVGRRQRPIINYSGGTEIAGGILMGNPPVTLEAHSFLRAVPWDGS